MNNSVLFLVCIIVAFLMFLLAALHIPPTERFDTVAIGLCFFDCGSLL